MKSILISFQVSRWGQLGATLVEYALLVGLIALVCISAATFMGDRVSVKYSVMADQFK